MKLLIVADDLTGALDTAAPLAARDVCARVWLDGCDSADLMPAQSGPQEPVVAAVNLRTRHLPAAAAADHLAEWSRMARSAIGPDTVLFKKIDSTLRGQVVPEVLAMAQALERHRILFAPAVLEQGRTMCAGQVLVHGQPLGTTEFSRDPQSPAPTQSIPELFAAASLPVSTAPTPPSGPQIWAPDISCPSDMEAAARWALDQPEATICVGAAGLAQAIGTTRFPTGVPAQWPQVASLLFVVGSRSEVSRGQVEQLQRQLRAPVFELPGGVLSQVHRDQLVTALAPRPGACSAAVVLPVDADRPREPSDVAGCLGHSVLQVHRLVAPGAIVLTGGDTALAVLDTLGVVRLDVGGQWSTGVPVSTVDIDASKVACVTKAGGFGTQDLFVQLVHGFASEAKRH